MIRVTLYTRKNCHLCDQARSDLQSLQTEFPHELVEIDIDSDPILRQRYMEHVPVAQVGPYKLEALFTATDLRIALGAAKDGLRRSQADMAVSRKQAINLHKAVLFLSRHWLATINLVFFLYIALPFGTPILMKVGLTRPAIWIQKIYSPLCHQLAYRSWFLFGEQPAYPLETAGTSLVPYGEATGLDPDDYWEAKEFIGNEQLGYKVVLCQRDIAIWGGMLIGGIIFGLLRGRMKPLPILLWFLVGVLPIALDGGTQILSSFPFLSFPHRESTPFLRTVTGVLFGLMNVWMAFPYVEESMNETRILVASKLAAAGKQVKTPE
ncbi:MAG TPA: DUF2085 domain-containing protein [Anaerolineae bacterium]|nr:DUF2085 domain-containing protein [Anaerolineae bacterium]